MEYVNRQIFGFETTEEYKEMIDLLIQLRTPKLSKDFKPSVINDILSDSLQPLSDDDLRLCRKPLKYGYHDHESENKKRSQSRQQKRFRQYFQNIIRNYYMKKQNAANRLG